MRRLIISSILVILMISLVSAEMIITQQPKAVYNLGDVITIPVTITTSAGGSLRTDLKCMGVTKEQGTEQIKPSSEEIRKEITLFMIKSPLFLGELFGEGCTITITFSQLSGVIDSRTTEPFKISNLITLTVANSSQTEFEPSKDLLIRGSAVKENTAGANGFIEMQLLDGNVSLVTQTETIRDGFFMLNTTLPAGMKAGAYLVKLNAYEKDANGLATNTGTIDTAVTIKQVPSNLEIVFENSEVEPGTSTKVKAILHDQTGVSIPSTVFLTIKNSDNIIMEQTEKATDDFLEFPIKYNEKPSSWTVVGFSSRLEAISNFTIKEKEATDIQIINRTVIVKNTGNVLYNKTVLVNLGNESRNINVSLKVDEEKKYILSAPDGEYNIEVKTAEGTSITGMASLTGREVGVRESEGNFREAIRSPTIWVTFILILGFMAFLIFKKVRKKNFFGFVFPRRNKKPQQEKVLDITEDSMNAPKNNRAELSLSIKGDKQDASVVCVRIKNLRENKAKEDVRNTLQKIGEIAAEQKAVQYESQDMIFFLLVPLRTKTFRNEEAALQISQGAKEILLDHNKLFKTKLDFGISLNHGDIIAKQEDTLKFMSIGTLTTVSKKIAILANENVLMSDKMNERVQRFAKTQRNVIDDFIVYSIREMKTGDKYKGFLDNFTKRYNEDKKEN